MSIKTLCPPTGIFLKLKQQDEEEVRQVKRKLRENSRLECRKIVDDIISSYQED